MVICDVRDHHSHAPVPHAPRRILGAQVSRAATMGLTPLMATELEFFVVRESCDTYRAAGFRGLTPIAGYNADYSIQLGAHHHTHHGTTNAVCMPEVLKFNAPAIRDRFDMAAAYLGISGGFDGFCAFVDTFNAGFAIPQKLSALGVSNADPDALTRAALKDPSTGGNPIEMTYDNTRPLIEALL